MIRSVEPIDGIGLMKIFRNTNEISKLTTGPGKLAKALKITRKHNNMDLVDINNKLLYIENFKSLEFLKDFVVKSSNRIGISIGIDRPWRYVMMVRNSSYDRYIPSSFLSRRS